MEEKKKFASEDEEEEYAWKNVMVSIKGIYFPPATFPWEEKIAQIRQMTLRDDDVLLLAYPKAGTHWLWEVINMLRNKTASPAKYSKMQVMMEFISVDRLNELPSPRTLNTHIIPSLLPMQEVKARRIKVVHVYRNPKDVQVSAYHMLRSLDRMVQPYPLSTFPKFIQASMFGGRPRKD